MRTLLSLVLGIICSSALLASQTADELVAKNLQAKGGLDKIKAIKTLRMIGRMQQGSFTAQVGEEAKAPNLLRETGDTLVGDSKKGRVLTFRIRKS